MARVLGKGLGNLIGGGNKGTAATAADIASSSNLKELKISEIVVNPNQPRKSFSQESIHNLAETIKQHGLIQPIVVKKVGDTYELVSGERRFRACKEAGFHKISAIVKNYSEQESMEVAIIENIQREDLNPIEEALAYQTLVDKYSIKISDLAARLGKNRSTISNLMRLLQLPEPVKEFVKTGKLSEGHARPLLAIGDRKKLESVANQIIEKGLNVRDVEDLVASLTEGSHKSSLRKESSDPTITQIETKIRNKLSAKVKISHNSKSGKGKILITYNNIDEMERILGNMNIK